MEEIIKNHLKYISGIAILLFVGLQFLFKNDTIIDNIDRAITITSIIVVVHFSFGWKYNPLIKIPRISGKYNATLVSDYDNKKRKIEFVIKQNLFNTRVYMNSKESNSECICTTLVKKEDNWQLIYTYQNVPNAIERHHSEIHFGTCIIDIVDKKMVKGMYYTDRKTIGDINSIIKI